jgi:putative flippase GtrA
MGIQVLVSAVSVGYLGFAPLVGKAASMAITFFWNFWARFKFIFKETPAYEQENTSGDSVL